MAIVNLASRRLDLQARQQQQLQYTRHQCARKHVAWAFTLLNDSLLPADARQTGDSPADGLCL